MLVFLAALLCPLCAVAEVQQGLFDRLPSMDDKILTSNVVMSKTSLNLGACSFHCLVTSKCKAFLHHQTKSLCQLQAAKESSGGKDEKGWVHYHKK